MSRYKEALEIITSIGNLPDAKTGEEQTQVFRAMVTGLLCDMALSLAVIADKLTEDKDDEQTTGT